MASCSNTGRTCAYFLLSKKRNCRMSVKVGRKYCGEHALMENPNEVTGAVGDVFVGKDGQTTSYERIACPYDPKHSCFVSQLAKHLEKCNSKPQPLPEYIKENVNAISCSEEEIKINLGTLSDDQLLAIIRRISKIHTESVGELPNLIGHHPVLESTLASLTESRGSWRHVFQNSSILYNMSRVGILTSGESSTYVEFGSGRGQLTYALGQAINLESDALLMIDKSSPRHKHDNRYKVDGESHASIHRIRADIADVDLGRVPLVRNNRRLVGTGKHLCGAATDLALNCLYRSNDPSGLVRGVCIALCCHHQCTWRHYVGKAFFKEVGLSPTDFAIMRAMTSWAVCNSRRAKEHDNPGQEEAIVPGRYAALGLDVESREKIGRQCKQIIDRGRVAFLSTWPIQAELIYYVDPEISPENVLLLAHS